MTEKAEKMTPEQQRAAFEATARELGCDESPDAFEAAVKKVARHKPVEERPIGKSEEANSNPK